MGLFLLKMWTGTSSSDRHTTLLRKCLRRTVSPKGTVIEFTMNSADSKIYPGIARDAGTFGTPDPSNPAKLIVTTSHPAPYTRKVAVYVPEAIRGGKRCAFHCRGGRSGPVALHGSGWA